MARVHIGANFDTDSATYRRFKAICADLGLNTQQAIIHLIDSYGSDAGKPSPVGPTHPNPRRDSSAGNRDLPSQFGQVLERPSCKSCRWLNTCQDREHFIVDGQGCKRHQSIEKLRPCRFRTEVQGQVYCDNPDKKSLPRTRLIPLEVCDSCWRRMRFEKPESREAEKPVFTASPSPRASQPHNAGDLTRIPCKLNNMIPVNPNVSCANCCEAIKRNGSCQAFDQWITKNRGLTP